MNGIFNIIKPAGITSNALLGKIKKHFNIKKVGHLGTLDPAGVGVLPVTVGKGTKLFDFFLKKDKTYLAVFTFGKTTDTLDGEGRVLEVSDVLPTLESIKKILPSFLGRQNQIPPDYSAKNVNGTRAYILARQNKAFKLQAKEVEIYSFKVLEQIDKNSYLFEIECSSGTYIRSLCKDLANALGSKAYMSCIIRTKSGSFEINSALTLQELLDSKTNEHLIGFEEILKEFDKIEIEDKYYENLKNGVRVKAKENFLDFDKEFLLYCKKELFGITKIEEGFYKIVTNLKTN